MALLLLTYEIIQITETEMKKMLLLYTHVTVTSGSS